jgi:hypothetical protein
MINSPEKIGIAMPLVKPTFLADFVRLKYE